MLVIENLTILNARSRPILNEISLCVRNGKIMGIVGPSGSGKTTIFRSVAGLLVPAHGMISIEGQHLTNMPVAKRPVSYLQQNFPLYQNMSVFQNVSVAFEATRDPQAGNSQVSLCEAMLTKVGIKKGLWDRKPLNLSGGEAQRVALAKCLLRPAKILLLDEPFSNLDKDSRKQLNGLVLEKVRKENCVCLYISHDENDVLFISDQVLLLENGRVVQSGSPSQLINNPGSSRAASLGTSLGLQLLSISSLKSMRSESHLINLLPKTCTKLGWRPYASRMVIEHHDYIASDSSHLIFPVIIEKYLSVGNEVYFSLSMEASDEMIWHSEPEDDHLSDKMEQGMHALLKVNVNDLFFLDDNDLILKEISITNELL